MDKFLAKIVKIFDTSADNVAKSADAAKGLFSKLFTTAGDKLLAINTVAMILAAAANTFAAAIDKNTSKEDKKFLVPAGFATGIANIAIYFAMTRKIIKHLEGKAEELIEKMPPEELKENTSNYVKTVISKEENKKIFKKDPEYIDAMKSYLLKDGEITENAIKEYSGSVKSAYSALGSLIGVALGCAVIATVIRDVSAYFVQKHLEKKNPAYKDKPYRPYFDPSHFKVGYVQAKQPLNLNTYMAFTRAKMPDSSMKI